MTTAGEPYGSTLGPVIHIGYHKAASSWFQAEFFPRARNAYVIPRSVVAREILLPSPFAFEPQTARRNFLSHAPGRIVMSEEELSGNLHTAGLHGGMSKEIAERLHRTFPDAHIVMIIRNQNDVIASAYKQYIQGGGTRSIERFLKPSIAPHKIPNFSLDFLVYDGLIGYYESLFGRPNVHVYPYEALRLEGRDFVAKIAADLDLDVDLARTSFAAVNVSHRRWTLRLMRLLNHFHDREIPNSSCIIAIPGFYKLLRFAASRLNRIALMGRREDLEDLLDASSVAEIEDRFRESNERVEKRYHLGLRSLGYSMPQDAPA